MADFHVQHEGSVFILYPHGHEAQEWIEEHIPEDAQRWGTGVAIESRYFRDILAAIQDDGLEVSR